VKANPHEIGRVVVSKQGHDSGRRFLVVGIVDEKYVLIADGDIRKLDNPKKKQVKHLRAEPEIPEAAARAIRDREETADSTIRKALAASAAQRQAQGPARADRNTDKEECALVQE